MHFSKSIYLMFGVLLIAICAGCTSHNSLPNAVYANNYSALTTSEQRAISPTNKTLSKREAINIALANNPGYKKAQYNADAKRAEYYKALGGLSPIAAATANTGQSPATAGVSANYQAFNGGTTTMNILEAKAKAEQSKWNVSDYRRKLIQDVTVRDNQLTEDTAILKIQKANEKFQNEMLESTIKKYNKGNATKADILNFKIQALTAKNAAVSAERDYKINSYKLAASMGSTTAELPNTSILSKNATADTDDIENEKSVPDVNYYLDTAIANRPDLKAQTDALKAAGYALYSIWGSFFPIVNMGFGNRFSSYLNWTLWNGGSRIMNIRSQETLLDIQEKILLEKWIDVVQSVRTEHSKLTASAARKKILDQANKTALQRRNLILKKYNAGKTDITTLNQAQSNLIKTEQSYNKAEIDVSNSRAALNAACGISTY